MYSYPRLFCLSLCGSVFGLTRCMVDDFYFWYCVEGVVACHEGIDAFSDFTYLAADIPPKALLAQRPMIMIFLGTL